MTSTTTSRRFSPDILNGVWLAIGIGLGAAIGAAAGNIGVGVGIGMSAGIVVAGILSFKRVH